MGNKQFRQVSRLVYRVLPPHTGRKVNPTHNLISFGAGVNCYGFSRYGRAILRSYFAIDKLEDSEEKRIANIFNKDLHEETPAEKALDVIAKAAGQRKPSHELVAFHLILPVHSDPSFTAAPVETTFYILAPKSHMGRACNLVRVLAAAPQEQQHWASEVRPVDPTYLKQQVHGLRSKNPVIGCLDADNPSLIFLDYETFSRVAHLLGVRHDIACPVKRVAKRPEPTTSQTASMPLPPPANG